ncbi:ATP-binding cassette domain-containing protein [Pseudactinotalea sp. HY160]|uniref:ABC transporter ATP-binding protein n=1 Tax=Pseudactinotalea sp. HY160 TaxID=2654490 RepID=UPI00128CB597|nr:ATP-binding cassette domain-containing protein [Pseudactinotalea sp. HY160]MPV50199.1 ATP-binding cassette domain-containing protein [Pseudactinotalea sp. HY160]
MAAPSSLTAADVHFSYPGLPVLAGVDLSIEAGQAPLGLVGASGAGKTTLLDLLAGVMRPGGGRATFNGRGVYKLRGKEGKHFKAAVRFMSQYSLTITDPRDTPKARLKNAAARARRGGRTHSVEPAEMLDAVGLEPRYLTRSMVSLSGGERQRVSLAVALATRPEILVLDEPLTAVDPTARGQIARSLSGTVERLGTSLLVASHDLELVNRLCPEVVFLAEGRLVDRGPLPELLAQPSHEAIAELARYADRAVQRFR